MRQRNARSLSITFAVLLFAVAVGSEAEASIVGYQVAIEPSLAYGANVPKFELSNLSDSLEVTNFTFTIGDTSFNFDGFTNVSAPSGVTYVFNGLDTNLFGGLNSDVVDLDLTGFTGGVVLSFDFDVDIDSDASTSGGPSFETVFWNNGAAAANSTISVEFGDGTLLSQSIGENPIPVSGSRYEFSQVSHVIPEPSTLLIWSLLGFAGVGAAGWRRKR